MLFNVYHGDRGYGAVVSWAVNLMEAVGHPSMCAGNSKANTGCFRIFILQLQSFLHLVVPGHLHRLIDSPGQPITNMTNLTRSWVEVREGKCDKIHQSDHFIKCTTPAELKSRS